MFNIGWQELTIIMVIVLIIFGPGKLPEIGSQLGKAAKSFKEAKNFDLLDSEDEPEKDRI